MTPKIFIISTHASGGNNGTVQAQLLDHLPSVVTDINQADVVITVAAWMHEFVFNPALLDIKKPLILLDYLEMGWDAGDKENRLGYGAMAQFGHLNTPEYAKLDQWVKDCPPRLTLKRELFRRDVSENMLPISWLCTIPEGPRHDRERYEARPLDALNIWGLSHPSRQRLHGKIFTEAHDGGYNVLDSWDVTHLEKRNICSIYSPWWKRKPITEVIKLQRKAKISVSLFGAGRRSFRDAESPVDCVMARPADDMAWPYDWHAGNSIQLRQGFEFEDLLAATRRTDLFDVYLESLANIDRYRPQRFVADYMNPILGRVV